MRFFEEVSKEFLQFPDVETILPKRSSRGSAGYDFFTKTNIVLKPGESCLLPTDIKAFFPENEVLMCFIRSSIGNTYNVQLKNGTGIIDSDFYNNPKNDGNIHLPLINNGSEIFRLRKNERVMQAIFLPYYVTNDDEVMNEKRSGGLGSSGR